LNPGLADPGQIRRSHTAHTFEPRLRLTLPLPLPLPLTLTRPQLIERLKQCIAVDEAYQDQYRLTRDALLAQPTGKQFELNENVVFGKLEVFCR